MGSCTQVVRNGDLSFLREWHQGPWSPNPPSPSLAERGRSAAGGSNLLGNFHEGGISGSQLPCRLALGPG